MPDDGTSIHYTIGAPSSTAAVRHGAQLRGMAKWSAVRPSMPLTQTTQRVWDSDHRPDDSFRWFNENLASLVPTYHGMWVAVYGNQVTASAATFHDAYLEAFDKKQSGAFLAYVPEDNGEPPTMIL